MEKASEVEVLASAETEVPDAKFPAPPRPDDLYGWDCACDEVVEGREGWRLLGGDDEVGLCASTSYYDDHLSTASQILRHKGEISFDNSAKLKLASYLLCTFRCGRYICRRIVVARAAATDLPIFHRYVWVG